MEKLTLRCLSVVSFFLDHGVYREGNAMVSLRVGNCLPNETQTFDGQSG